MNTKPTRDDGQARLEGDEVDGPEEDEQEHYALEEAVQRLRVERLGGPVGWVGGWEGEVGMRWGAVPRRARQEGRWWLGLRAAAPSRRGVAANPCRYAASGQTSGLAQ
jgi:hypothetical protein